MSMNTILTLGLVAGVGYFLYTGDLQKWLDQLSGQVNEMLKSAAPSGGGAGPAPEGPAAPGPGIAPPGGGGGGGTVSGGGTCPGGTSCASGNDGSRNECDGIKAAEYEATWCGSFSGDDLSIKVWGPNHTDSTCCWCILSVSPAGEFGMRFESPHPSTTSKSNTTAAIGKPSCIKAVVRRGPGGILLEGWGFVGGQWKKALTYTGKCGRSTSPASSQQVSFRCDGSLNTTCATVKPLGGGGGAPSPEESARSGAVEVGPGVRIMTDRAMHRSPSDCFDDIPGRRPSYAFTYGGGDPAVGAARVSGVYDYEFMPHVASEDENYTFNRIPVGYDYFVGASCGGLTGATGAACRKKQSTLFKKPKPIVVPKKVPFSTKKRGGGGGGGGGGGRGGGITPAPTKAGKGQPPATRATYEEEVRRTPCRAGESEDSCQRRRLASIKGNSPEAVARRNVIVIQQWRTHIARKALQMLAQLNLQRQQRGLPPLVPARLAAQQGGGGYRPVVFGGLGSGAGFSVNDVDPGTANAFNLAHAITKAPESAEQRIAELTAKILTDKIKNGGVVPYRQGWRGLDPRLNTFA